LFFLKIYLLLNLIFIFTIKTSKFMKKLLLAALALTGTFSLAQANTLTVNNTTGCAIYMGLNSVGLTYAMPGSTVVTFSPDITNAKFEYPLTTGLYSGSFAVGFGYPFVSTAGYAAPGCSTATGSIAAIWQQATPTGDVVLTFL
jgi:hypothetical protein